MSGYEVREAFRIYAEYAKIIAAYGAGDVLDDLYTYYPSAYVALEREFKHRQKVKELGVLLVNSSRRETT